MRSRLIGNKQMNGIVFIYASRLFGNRITENQKKKKKQDHDDNRQRTTSSVYSSSISMQKQSIAI